MSTSHIISYKCSKFECQSQKLSDAFAGVYLHKYTGERDHRSQTGLDPPHSTKRTFAGVAVDTGTVSRMVLRMAVPLGYSSAAEWVSLPSALTRAHFAFHRTISTSNHCMALSLKSGSYVLKIYLSYLG